MANQKISQLSNAAALTGTEQVPIVQSGSTVKATTLNIGNLALPSQTGQNGKYLQTNGTTASWQTVASGGVQPAILSIFLTGGFVLINVKQTISGATWTGTVGTTTITLTPSVTSWLTPSTIAVASTIINGTYTDTWTGINEVASPGAIVLTYFNSAGTPVNISVADFGSSQLVVIYP